MGTSMNAKIPNRALSSARRSGSSISVRSSKIADVEQPQNERGGQPRVPGPVDSPGRIGPNRPGNQQRLVMNTRPTSAQDTPSQSHFWCSAATRTSRLAMKHTKNAVILRPTAGGVKIKNPLKFAHGVLVGRNKESAYAAATTSETTTVPQIARFAESSCLFLQQIFAEKPQRRQKNHVKTARKPIPFHCKRVAGNQPEPQLLRCSQSGWASSGSSRIGNSNSRMRACAEIAESRRTCQSEIPRLPRKKYEDQRSDNSADRTLTLTLPQTPAASAARSKRRNKCIGSRVWREKSRTDLATASRSALKRVVILLTQKTRLQHQRRSKQKCQPQQSWREPPRFVGRRYQT